MDKDFLTSRRLPTKDIPIEGGVITVRALTRTESMQVGTKKETIERERFMLVCAMVEPPMTYQDVKAWQDCSPAGELEMVTTEIARLSGMLPGQQEEITRRFPDDGPDGEVRDVPDEGAGLAFGS